MKLPAENSQNAREVGRVELLGELIHIEAPLCAASRGPKRIGVRLNQQDWAGADLSFTGYPGFGISRPSHHPAGAQSQWNRRTLHRLVSCLHHWQRPACYGCDAPALPSDNVFADLGNPVLRSGCLSRSSSAAICFLLITQRLQYLRSFYTD